MKPRPACADYPPDMWFAEAVHDQATAKIAIDICRGCPLKDPCAEIGIRERHRYGIFGGLTASDRDRIIRRERRAR